MLGIKLLCVGKLREKHFINAFDEYAKRLSAFCRFETEELAEIKLPESPSRAQIDSALLKEAAVITDSIPKNSYVIAMCVEGTQFSSEELASLIEKRASWGDSRFCFVVGGSYGLHESVKQAAQLKLSMSKMTFPHHLARVMLAEQLYRAMQISSGAKYHK